MSQSISLGLSPPDVCSYLNDRTSRIAVVMEDSLHTPNGYEMFLNLGFRRSGDMIYQPYCQNCQSCQPIRVLTDKFKPTKSQKRTLNKAKQCDIHWELKAELDHSWFTLYSDYICARHTDGSMFPPNKKSFLSFIEAHWIAPQFLHVYQQNKLIAIAVTDVFNRSLSAFYTFFDPTHSLSLGQLAILYQIELACKLNKKWLYLGFQIDECPSMSYKDRYHPHQKLVNQAWQG